MITISTKMLLPGKKIANVTHPQVPAVDPLYFTYFIQAFHHTLSQFQLINKTANNNLFSSASYVCGLHEKSIVH